MSWLSAVFVAALLLAQVAFGWHPCCCVATSPCITCPGTGAPTVMHGIFTVAAGCCNLDGLPVTFTYNSGTGTWQIAAAITGKCSTAFSDSRTLTISCFSSTQMSLGVNEAWALFGGQYFCSLLPAASNGVGSVLSSSVTCGSAFQAVFSGTLTNGGTGGVCPCSGSAWTLTVTA